MGRVAGKYAAEMQMNFSYGKDRRVGIQSPTTMDAILAGERTATTRFPMWYGRNPDQLARIKAMEPGSLVRFYDQKGREAIAETIASPLSRQQMEMADRYPQLQGLGGATYAISKKKLITDPRWLDRWSQLEGWSPEAALKFFDKEPLGYGYQFQYRLV